MERIKKNDTVFVSTGKDKGKKGRVMRVFSDTGFALVQGINYTKKAARRTREDQQGGILTRENKLSLSNLMVVGNSMGLYRFKGKNAARGKP